MARKYRVFYNIERLKLWIKANKKDWHKRSVSYLEKKKNDLTLNRQRRQWKKTAKILFL
jgi:hypothetical protein